LGQTRLQRRFEFADIRVVNMASDVLQAGQMSERSCNLIAVRLADLRYLLMRQSNF
jgi:hypothetical protein